MGQAADTDLYNPLPLLVPKAPKSEWQNLIFPLQIKLVKISVWISIISNLGTNGLMKHEIQKTINQFNWWISLLHEYTSWQHRWGDWDNINIMHPPF